MTTQKTISALTELTAAGSTDDIPIVDNSGQSSVTKRITVQNAFKSVPAGQAATPGLAFAGDVDTGISRVGADQLALCTGGQARLTVGATGDITIGSNLIVDGTTTTISSETLLVEDKNIELGTVASPSNATADGGGITLKGATDKTIKWISGTEAWTFNNMINVQTSVSSTAYAELRTDGSALGLSANLTAGSSASDSVALNFKTSNSGNETTKMRIDPDGKVGIGTTDPDALLHVNSSGSTGRIRIQGGGSSSAQLQLIAGGQTNPFVITQDSSRNLIFFDNATPRLTITSTGNAEFGGAGDFAGSVNAGDSTNGPYTYLQPTGAVDIVGTHGYVLRHRATTAGSVLTLLDDDGSASFAATNLEIDATGQLTIKKSTPYTDPSFRVLDRDNSNADGVLIYGNGRTRIGDGSSTVAMLNLKAAANLEIARWQHTTSGYGYMLFKKTNGTDTYGYIGDGVSLVQNGTDNDFAIRAENNLLLSIGNSEKVRLNSSGTVLIGGTSTADDDHANIDENGKLTIRRASASDDAIVVKEGSTNSFLVEADGFFGNFNVASSTNPVAFAAYDNNAGTSGPYVGMGAADGEAVITAGSTASDDVPLVFRTASSGTETEEMRLLPGGGLTFNGDTAQANALDDYEEGTWTPGLEFGGSTSGIVYANQYGSYVKIGRFVTLRGRVTISNNGSGTGDVRLTGLPYTVSDVVSTTSLDGGGHFIYQNNISGVYGPALIAPRENTTEASLYGATATSGQTAALQDGNITNTFDSRFTLSYETAT